MAKDLSYLFSQLRRIEDHREEKAAKEIRKIYKQMLKESRQFIAEEYYNLAEDGKLTFDILRGKGQDARFLSEVEQRFNDLSLDVSKEIRKTVEEVYKLSFDGLRDAVKKSKDAAELKELLDVPSINTAQTMWASVNNTIMDVALEKNHKSIIWDIKREVATALTVGDRFDTMADRLAKSLNGNYKKANLIARTEIGRVREAGHLAAAKDINETIAQGSSGLRMVKKWMSMRDGKVRDQHQEMHGTVVEMGEPFELPDGTETQAPKQSGVARHDCNCRCTCLYPLMDDEMFFKAAGKHFKNTVENSENSIIIQGAGSPYPEYSRVLERTPQYNAEKTNPQYKSGKYEYTHNCQRCVPAWELRERGFDVEAMPRRPFGEPDSLETSPFSLWEFNAFDQDKAKRVQIDNVGTGKDGVIRFLEACGDGARCEIVVEWDVGDSGHAFCAKNIGGQVVFIDPQSGKSGEAVEEYFNLVKLGETRWLRIDNLAIRESCRKDVIKNPYGKD